jgi:Cu2+-exporting ATPase
MNPDMDRHDMKHEDRERSIHHNHHSHMVQDFKNRFKVSLILAIPLLLLSRMIQLFLGLTATLQFNGDRILLFLFATAAFLYGGYPFSKDYSKNSIRNSTER